MATKTKFSLLLLRLIVIVSSLLVLFGFSGCQKVVDRKIYEGQIALTFDDHYIDNWYEYMPLFDSLDIKATFYVCRYHEFTPEQKQKLQKIEDYGHEIGYHTANHPDLVKVLQQRGMEAVINDEIRSDLSLMRKDGFRIMNFAYPYGSQCMQLNSVLKRYFKSVRMVCNKTNWNKSLTRESGDAQMLYGAGIDQSSKLSIPQMLNLMDAARGNHDCVVFTAHGINQKQMAFQIEADRIRMLASEARKRNLKFVTINQAIN